MSERRINREEWATLISELIVSETRGNRSAFARMVGVDYKTVGRWLKSEVDVSEESVRAVARAASRPTADLLVRLGYYRADEVTAAERPAADPDDEAMRLILESEFPPRMKMMMIQRLEELRDRDRAAALAREAEEVKWWIEQAKAR